MNTEKATFAAGCFWGVESTFRKVPGVLSTQVGYSGGRTVNPTYQQVCSDRTGHAEAVEIAYEPSKVSYQALLEVFFENHDPTTSNRQGPDFGSQYRSVVFFHNPQQQRLAQAEKERRDRCGQYVGPIVTEIVAAGPFYRAEQYHQQYYQKQGVSWSCHFGNGKKANAVESCTTGPSASCGVTHWQSKSEEEWRKILTPEQYHIARQAGTERAFSGKYWNTHSKGVYHCAACGQALFSSQTKFESGTGWPSFWQSINDKAVTTLSDSSQGMTRTEVRCSQCGAHLGHVFDDGPPPTGLRYCLNSAVLNLVAGEPK